MSPDLLIGREAWNMVGLADKWIMWFEMILAGFIASPAVRVLREKTFKTSHFDTDKTDYHKELAQNWDSWTNFKAAPWEIIDDFIK